MSALTAALAAFAATVNDHRDDDNSLSVAGPSTARPLITPVESDPPCSASPTSPPSLTHSGVSSSSSSLYDVPAISAQLAGERPNEHLAVLLPKAMWKPDNLASVCDNLYCRVSFGLFERRHHCRKCGGVFCAACTSRNTPLLDTSNLEFTHPPRNIPITAFDSPTSPVLNSRVCDDCYDQIHGLRTTPHTPSRPHMKRALSHPISMLKMPLTALRTGSESSLSSRASSPVHLDAPSRTPRSLRNSPSISSLNSSSSSASSQQRTGILRTGHLPLPADLERSYGELDAYPLKRSSVLCKATGGGRWEPKQSPVLDGYRPPVPGAKAPYEIEMEREEQEERRRRENPIVTDGEFRYRFIRRHPSMTPTPTPECSNPFSLSTF
ncbi:hypothetical protein CC1G_13402 [Coprinopsis cinerea okayama7|uniref:FYVE-type domain-containing protein n=1 Tax=Coprinopsis cinerea (strain Okayama-7 / 130 / ATCC MYA-4618 / FGSC 9003) TaxID=240176 RepID=A8PIC0_COPC7|nr:hypothetical protein CC1G_13402 [Coprinopsis cinerea okayama7\|eukprot:XP_001841549.1 hypothetical protein CC1G_13402 [Coprinopsis cinerea okayama7\